MSSPTDGSDPRVISLDLETPGKFVRDDLGVLPEQTTFHPRKMRWIDGITPDRLIQSVSITIPTEDPRWSNSPTPPSNCVPCLSPSSEWLRSPVSEAARRGEVSRLPSPTLPPGHTSQGPAPSSNPWKLEHLARLRPGSTLYLPFRGPEAPRNRRILRDWLAYADTLAGQNIQYDILCLRSDPEFRFLLAPFQHFIIDLSVLNYQDSELRVERSLKDVGPVTREFSYDEDEKGKKYLDCHDPGARLYNCSDTHNVLLGISFFARRILENWAHTDKFSPFACLYYSDLIWTCIIMAEQGIPMSRSSLARLQEALLRRSARIRADLAANHSLIIDKEAGEGPQKSKEAFFDTLIEAIDSLNPHLPSCRGNRLLQLTDKKKAISLSEENRTLLSSLLPPSHPLKGVLTKWDTFSRFQKLVSTYTYPLLHSARKDPTNRKSALVPPSHLLEQPCSISPTSVQVVTGSVLPLSGSVSSSASPSRPSLGSPSAGSPTKQSRCSSVRDDIWYAFPSWFPCPSPFKDSGGSEGGTVQGRITVKDPAAQTFPPAIQKRIRSRYGREGVIAAYDLEQIELKVAALLSGDASLCSEYAQAKPDLHGKRAIQVFGPDVVNRPGWRSGDMTVDPRQWAKTLNFADLFLASPFRMQRTIQEGSGILMPIRLFEEIQRSRATLRAGLTQWQYSILCFAEKYGHLHLPHTGHTRHFDGFRVDHEWFKKEGILRPYNPTGRREDGAESLMNEIVNMPIQTTAGVVMQRVQAVHLRLLGNLDLSPVRIHPFLNVYDAIKFDCHLEDLPTLDRTVNQAFEIVRNSDYWYMLTSLFGRSIPLTTSRKLA